MVAPIDYTLNVKSPFESAIQGLQLGAGLADMQAKRDLQAANVLKAQQEAQALAQAQAQAQQFGQMAQTVLSNPNASAKDFGSLLAIAPDKDRIKMVQDAWTSKDKREQEGILTTGGQVMAALRSQNPTVGVELLRTRAQALRNTGDEAQAKAYEAIAADAEKDPVRAGNLVGYMLMGVPGGDKVIEGVTKMDGEQRAAEVQPFKLSEAKSSAEKAAVQARFAESQAVMDLEKSGWDIKKLQNDMQIAKQNAAIAAMNAATAREGNTIKRQEMGLKLQEMQEKRDSAVREKVATVESARASMDNMLNTADRILQTPKNIIGSAAGPISSRMPTLSQDTADLEELVNTLGSQAFLAQIPNIKGMGALSNAEGEKLTAALQNFSLRQSPERLLANVKEAQRLILKGRQNLARQYGVPESIPDTPAVEPTQADVDALLKKYGGR